MRTVKRKNKDGSTVEYIQLAHNTRHPEKGYPRAEVLYSFGRRDQLDVEAIKRLVGRSRYAAEKNLNSLYNSQRDPIPGTFTKGRLYHESSRNRPI